MGIAVVADGSGTNSSARLAADLSQSAFHDSLKSQIGNNKINTV